MSHTPGPWEAVSVPSAGWSVRMKHPRPGYKGPDPVCSLAWFQFDIPGIIDDKISGANAKLIAAAPDLLAALEDMLSGWKYIRQAHGDLYGVGWDRAQEKAEAAVKKARGE